MHFVGRPSAARQPRIYSHLYSTLNSTAATKSIFAHANAAKFLAGAGSVQSIPKLNGLPEIIVTGRANCGKSTLLNTVLGRSGLLHTSTKAGRTRELNFYQAGQIPGKLVVVDAPGYGSRGRPEWGQLFDQYLKTRKELRRVYILFSAKNGVNNYDVQMLQHLSSVLITPEGSQPWALQSIITKADSINSENASSVISTMKKQIWEAAPLCLPPIITSAAMSPPFGIDELRKNIAEACGLLR